MKDLLITINGHAARHMEVVSLNSRLVALSNKRTRYNVIISSSDLANRSSTLPVEVLRTVTEVPKTSSYIIGDTGSGKSNLAQRLLEAFLATQLIIKIAITSKPGLVISGYLLKKVSDECWDWLKERTKGHSNRSGTIEIYGPDNKLLKTVKYPKTRSKSADTK